MSQRQRDGVAFASTPQELLDAVLQGWRHIVITAHLDLTELPLRETAICPDGCASPLAGIEDTASIRGACSGADGSEELEALAATLDGAPLLPLQPEQCLVLTYEDSLPTVTKHLWMDNLYLRIKYTPEAPNDRQYQYATLGGLAPLIGPLRWQAQHYITRSTFQGDGLGPAVGVWADENAYIENCTFADLGGDAFADGCTDCSAAISVANVSVTVVNSTFLEPSPFPGTAYIRAWDDSRVVVSGCTFADTPQLPDLPFYVADESMIYTDTPGVRMRFEDDGLEVAALPLEATPTDPADPTEAILRRSDPWFVNITSELDAELPPQPAFPAPAATSPLLQPPGSEAEVAAPPPPPAESADDDPPTAAIVGGAIGAVLLLLALAVCCVLWRKRAARRQPQEWPASKASRRHGGSEVPDMVTTGSHSDMWSVPSGKLPRAQSSLRPGSVRAQGSLGQIQGSLVQSTSDVSAAPGAVPLGPIVKPTLSPDADLPELLEFVQAQLYSIGPDVTLQEQFALLGPGQSRTGGQSVVAYAQGAFSSQPYILKFFPLRTAFDAELALREDEAFARLLPTIRAVHDPARPESENMPIHDRWGQPLPPCIAMPRGESLIDWLRRAKPDIFQAASVVAHIAACLCEIHAAGYVHGAVKPAHIILLREANRWTLVDFDRAAAIGAAVPPPCALPYAPPEAVAACDAGTAEIIANPAMDAWSLGVVAFELLTGKDAFDSLLESDEQVTAQLLGRAPLPWEGERLSEATSRNLGIFREPLLALLQRDPAQRASMQDFCNACHDVVASNTTTAV